MQRTLSVESSGIVGFNVLPQSIQRFNFVLIMHAPSLASALKRGILPLKVLIMAIKNGQGEKVCPWGTAKLLEVETLYALWHCNLQAK